MKKGTIKISLILALTLILSLTATALAPGFSDYDATASVTISGTSNAALEIVSAKTGVKISFTPDACPASVTSVVLETKALKGDDQTKVINDAKKAKLSKESATIGANYNISVVSAVTLQLFDQNKKEITKLTKPITITVPLPRKANTIAYINPDTSELVILEGTIKGGFITFETDIVGVNFVFLYLNKK